MLAYFLKGKKKRHNYSHDWKRIRGLALWCLFMLVHMLLKRCMRKYGNQNDFHEEAHKRSVGRTADYACNRLLSAKVTRGFCQHWLFTFLTVLSFVPWVASTRAHDADAPAPALRVDALRGRHVALRALPAAEAQAASLRVLPVAAAQDRTGRCEIKHDTAVSSCIPSKKSRLPAPPSLLPRSFPGLLGFRRLIYPGLRKDNGARIPLEQSGPRNPGKQWQVPETHSPFPWQFRGHSTTDSEAKRKDKRWLCRLPLAQGRCQGQWWPFDHFGYVWGKEGWLAPPPKQASVPSIIAVGNRGTAGPRQVCSGVGTRHCPPDRVPSNTCFQGLTVPHTFISEQFKTISHREPEALPPEAAPILVEIIAFPFATVLRP